ncbi:hypothetical protein C8R47DRAFT_1130252 [Mycena vitilis]|nr:hypothetical protein C8R47DRAFT_1130252 [Mycena vitilis]
MYFRPPPPPRWAPIVFLRYASSPLLLWPTIESYLIVLEYRLTSEHFATLLFTRQAPLCCRSFPLYCCAARHIRPQLGSLPPGPWFSDLWQLSCFRKLLALLS